ncbi:glutathione S-transferase family protein [Endozoicomonas ascidiicola]|uniref:glutathione S-transferase family protein n=1 Tax=Endozoicomonas ascidiicola TaxID=1698521 RepID=UPI0008336487|nr:glutathione S-transferase family protein [Endozoicomonas ascidiicola]
MIKVHHLEQSRSTRVLWLLEEIGVEYQRIDYQRDPQTRLAPHSMREVHPLGKAPIVEDNGLLLVESAAILEYLLDQYAPDQLRPAKGSPEYYVYQQWMHFVEGSAMLPVLLKLFLGEMEDQSAPVFGYAQKEFELDFGYINSTLQSSSYLAGEDFTAADIMMVNTLLFAKNLSMLENYPAIQAYIQRISERQAFQTALSFG